jgi:type IV secretion system protein VirD4
MLTDLMDRIGGPRTLLIASLVALVAGVMLPWHTPILTTAAVLFGLFLLAGNLTARAAPDIHGSAMWASVKEIKNGMAKNEAPQVSGAVVEMGEVSEGTGSVPVSWKTDKHVLIVASAGSGKGTDLIIPNLLGYDGPVFVLDPKGENARATVRRRNEFGPVHCLDPWGLTGRPQSRFNPLARLCLEENASEVATESASLASALVLPGAGDNNRYFTDSARQLLEALIAYVVCDPQQRERADLPLVRRLLTRELRPTLEKMQEAPFGPDTIRSNAGRMMLIGDNKEFGAIVSSAITETAFLDDPRLKDSLACNPVGQIDFSEWQSGKAMSVYLCLPAPYFKTFNRWLRLIVTAALDEMMRRHKPPAKPVMFMLDELATLGRLDQVENAVGLARGYGVQIWSIFQDIGQIRGTYEDKWSSFVGNAGLRLFFGTQDYETAKVVSDMIGDETVEVGHWNRNSGVDYKHHGRRLLMPDEVMRMRPESMIAFIPGMKPVAARRVPYYRNPTLNELWDDPRGP